jgi:hypothetical protein
LSAYQRHRSPLAPLSRLTCTGSELNYEEITEEQLDRAAAALGRAEHKRAFLPDTPLSVLVQELGEWLEDDRQWGSAQAVNWVSLLDDLDAARSVRNTAFVNYLDCESWAWDELADCRRTLQRGDARRGPDPALRRRLHRAQEQVATRLNAANALIAIWADLLVSPSHPAAEGEVRCLAALLGAQGRRSTDVCNYLAEILGDDENAVARAREEEFDIERRGERAGLSVAERATLGAKVLRGEALRGEMVVWMRYGLAEIDVNNLKVGEAISFYQPQWLAERLAAGDRAELPSELQPKDYTSVEALTGIGGGEDGGVSGTELEEVPYVVVRVALGRVRSADALELARESVELLVSLLTLQGEDPSVWVLAEDYVSFRDGQPAGSSMHAPNVSGVTLDQRSAIYPRAMPEVVRNWGAELKPHLPLRRPDLRGAAQLALWLRRARETWDPGRLVLCDRIFERVAGWAGYTDRRQFIEQNLRLGWAMGRVRLEVSDCWRAIADDPFARHHLLALEAWEEIKAYPPLEYEDNRESWRVNLRGLMANLDFVVDRLKPETPLRERFGLLKLRFQDGSETARWIDQLLDDFDVFERRARRVRNSLIHGGPLSEESSRSVLAFVDWLAADALHTTIRGLLREEDLLDCFLDRRQDYMRSHAALRNGELASEVFFGAIPQENAAA